MQTLKSVWATNPVRVSAIVAAVVVFIAAKAGIAVDEQEVGEALLLILPILLGGEIARAHAQPATPPIGDDSDALLASQLRSERGATLVEVLLAVLIILAIFALLGGAEVCR